MRPRILLSLVLAGSLASYAQSPSMIPSSLPTSQPASAAEQSIRNARASYFDHFAGGEGVKLEDRDPGVPPAFVIHDAGPKTELPTDLSDTIVLGSIVGSQAFPSQNHEAI